MHANDIHIPCGESIDYIDIKSEKNSEVPLHTHTHTFVPLYVTTAVLTHRVNIMVSDLDLQ